MNVRHRSVYGAIVAVTIVVAFIGDRTHAQDEPKAARLQHTSGNLPSKYTFDHQNDQWNSYDELRGILEESRRPDQWRAISKNLCGPIACRFAAETLLGIKPDLVDLVESCRVESGGIGSSVLAVKETCEDLGFFVEAHRVDSKKLTPDLLPAIIHFDNPDPHLVFVPLLADTGSVLVCDVDRMKTLSAKQFRDRWSGYVLTLRVSEPEPTNVGLWPYLAGAIIAITAWMLLSVILARTKSSARHYDVLLLGIVFTMTCGCEGAESKKIGAPQVVFTSQRLDLGKVVEGVPVEVAFEYQNAGTAPLELEVESISCGCGKFKSMDTPLAPGDTGYLTLTYTDKKKGSIYTPTKTLSVASNDPNAASVMLAFTANVVHEIELDSDESQVLITTPTEPLRGAFEFTRNGRIHSSDVIAVESKHGKLSVTCNSIDVDRGRYRVEFEASPPLDFGQFVDKIIVGQNEKQQIHTVRGTIAGPVTIEPGMVYWGLVSNVDAADAKSVRVDMAASMSGDTLGLLSAPIGVSATVERLSPTQWAIQAHLELDELQDAEGVHGDIVLQSSAYPDHRIIVPAKAFITPRD